MKCSQCNGSGMWRSTCSGPESPDEDFCELCDGYGEVVRHTREVHELHPDRRGELTPAAKDYAKSIHRSSK